MSVDDQIAILGSGNHGRNFFPPSSYRLRSEGRNIY
jgi:hypothetical protein